jgi:hypothetical protein
LQSLEREREREREATETEGLKGLREPHTKVHNYYSYNNKRLFVQKSTTQLFDLGNNCKDLRVGFKATANYFI